MLAISGTRTAVGIPVILVVLGVIIRVRDWPGQIAPGGQPSAESRSATSAIPGSTAAIRPNSWRAAGVSPTRS